MYIITKIQFCQVILKIDIPKSEVCNANVNIGTASPSRALTLNHIFQGQGFCKFTEIHKGLRDLSDKLNLNCLITLNENFCLKIYLGSCCNSHHTWATSLPDSPNYLYSHTLPLSPHSRLFSPATFQHKISFHHVSFKITKIKTMRLLVVVCFGLLITRWWEDRWRMWAFVLVCKIIKLMKLTYGNRNMKRPVTQVTRIRTAPLRTSSCKTL